MTFPNRRFVSAAVAAALLLLAPLHAAGRSFAWKATGKGGVVYLVGSIHMLSSAMYPLAPSLESAYKDSDLLVEEVDLAQMMDPSSQMQLLMRGMLPSSQSLEKVLTPATYALVSKRLEGSGAMEPLKLLKPWMVALMIEADDQLSIFDTMTMDQQDHMLAQTIKDIDAEQAQMAKMMDAWKAGDITSVERVVLTGLKEDPTLYQRLLVGRNRNWMPKIEALFARRGHALVVVGAAHLVGPDGLVAMLKAKGYAVEQM
jgi:uncharacterized protein YbaP (TraB family)